MYRFKKPIDPESPLDPSDPPPDGWREIDRLDYQRWIFGHPEQSFMECRRWEERELERYEGQDVVSFINF